MKLSAAEASVSAQTDALLFAGICAHKEGFELSFALHIDQATTLTWIAQLLQDIWRLLCHLQHKHNHHFIYFSDLDILKI